MNKKPQKFQERAVVLHQEQLIEGVFSLLLGTKDIARAARPGQFVSVYSSDSGRLLPRPISICEADAEKGILRLVYRTAGEGTREFSRLESGDLVDIIGPLGNGYPLEAGKAKHAVLIGGGIGIPPLVQLAKTLSGGIQSDETMAEAQEAEQGSTRIADKVTAVIGYRDEHLFLDQELSRYADLQIATEDGSIGTKGNVLDCIRENNLIPDPANTVIYACGPTPMLRALQNFAKEQGIECYLSLEQRMACGIGACLACVCESKEKDEHSQVHNKRICAEGPVFHADEIVL